MNSNHIFAILILSLILIILSTRITLNSSGFLICMIIMGYSITKDIKISMAVALFSTYIFVFLNSSIKENFKINKNKKNKKHKKHKKHKTQVKQVESEYTDEEISDDEDEDYGNHVINKKESFLENYKALSGDQAKGLNKDTQELIKTQKNLIDTLNKMGPTLKEGKNVLDTFKNYFGKDVDLKNL